MLTETFELDLANSGLAGLDEVSLLRLYASAQARAIVHGTGRTLRDIENADGVPLYPAFYRTLVKLPPPALLARHRTWDRVEIAVEVQRYGRMLLESTGRVGAPGTLSGSDVIRIEGSLVFVHDQRAEHVVDAPREGAIAALPPPTRKPASLDEQRRVRSEGLIARAGRRPSLTGRTTHTVLVTRDVQPGRAMMFPGFTTLFEIGEQTLFVSQAWPPLDPSLLSFARLLEREVHYVGNVHQGDEVRIETTAAMTPCPKELEDAYEDLVGVAAIEIFSEVYDGRNRLVAAARTRKLFAVPRTRASDLHDVRRMLHQHGEANG